MAIFSTDSEFEDEIRRVARHLWPKAEYSGADIIDGRERDGIFETDDFVNCIECTVSKQLSKAKEDGDKLDKLMKRLAAKHPTKLVRGWFVTLNEPTADQRNAISKYKGRINACSYDQFRSKLIDARSYIELREKYPFGSVRDPKSGATDFPFEYIPLDIVDETGASRDSGSLCDDLAGAMRVLLTGDYGAGKSATSREVFLRLAKRFWSGSSNTFPVLLNLRDHHGQTNPVEALERHARNIGLAAPDSLVRAWRAGYCLVMLDGFDEIASAGWASIARRLADLRYRSMELIRCFVRETPRSQGLLIAGRAHFFDSNRELMNSLGLTVDFQRLHLIEFSSEQVEAFLKKLGWKAGIPEWLPTRPLLLAYLATHDLLRPELLGESALGPAAGWHGLLDRISEREAEIEAGIDTTSVRRLIEHLASAARASIDGLGPLSPDVIIECFKSVCGGLPDDRGAVLLQRLPGLGGTSAEDGSRVFIDKDFADVARAGDVYHFVELPYAVDLDSTKWQSTVGSLGADVAAHRCALSSYNEGKINAALEAAYKHSSHVLCSDIVLILDRMGANYNGPRIYLREVICDHLLLDGQADFSGIEFQDSVFSRLELELDVDAGRLPCFRRCHFAGVLGRSGERDLPRDRFIECTYEDFEYAAQTTNALLALPLPLPTKVMLTIIKKIFAQSGAGRKETALYRGLDARAQSVVQDVLVLLRKYGFILRTKQGAEVVWLPSKAAGIRKRALSMLASPMSSKDPLFEESREG